MRRRDFKIIFLLGMLLLPPALRAKDNTNDYLSIDLASNAVRRIAVTTNGVTALTDSNSLPKIWFPVGEETVSDIYWGIIHVGTTRVVTDWVEQDGRPRLRIRHLTKTNRVMAQIYPVEDTIETLIDPDKFLPVYFRTAQNEGHYHKDEITVFNHAAGFAEQGSFRNGHVKKFKIEPDTRDIVTLMYWLRRNPFTVGTTNMYRVMADEKLYDLFIRPTAEEKQKIGDYGKVDVTRIEPDAAFNGLFMRKGKITVWVSRDERRVCTKVEAEVPVANIHIVLDQVLGPGTDAWVKKEKK